MKVVLMHDDGQVDAFETDRMIMVTDGEVSICNVSFGFLTHAVQLATTAFVNSMFADGKDPEELTEGECRDVSAQSIALIAAAAARYCDSWSKRDEAFGKWGDALMEETGRWLDELGYEERVTMAELVSEALMRELKELGL